MLRALAGHFAFYPRFKQQVATKSMSGIAGCFQEIGRVLCEEQLGPCFIPYEMCGEAVNAQENARERK